MKVKRLNCTVKGGISSFLLFHLVYYFFKDKEIKQKDYEKIKILDFLVDFLFFYSEFKNKKYSLLISKNDVKIPDFGTSEQIFKALVNLPQKY